MDQNAFLKATQYPPGHPKHPEGAGAPVAPPPQVPIVSVHSQPPPVVSIPHVATPPVHPPVPPPSHHWFSRWGKWGIPLAALLLLVLVGGGSVYYIKFKPLSEERVLKSIRSSILPSIVLLSCAAEKDGPEEYFGTGAYFIDDGIPSVETNAHVILAFDGNYYGCSVYFPRPEDGTYYDSAYVAGIPRTFERSQGTVKGEDIAGIDYAVLPIVSAKTDKDGKEYPFPPEKPDVYAVLNKLCRQSLSNASIGNKLYLLGYPDVGGQSITLTEGVVSGFSGENDELIKVSANTAHGNSGGLAIGSRSGCSYGIPSGATFQEGGNLGYVLSKQFIQEFVNNLTGKATYVPLPKSKTQFTDYSFPDFSLRYPADWEVATSTTIGDVAATYFSSPQESALDGIQEELIVGRKQTSTKDVSEVIATLMSSAKEIDPEAKINFIDLSGQEAFMASYIDNSLIDSNVPYATNKIVLYLSNGYLYTLQTVAEYGPGLETYNELFIEMIDSIRFK